MAETQGRHWREAWRSFARAAADPLLQLCQLGGQGGKLATELVVLPPESLNFLLQGQDQRSDAGWGCQPVGFWNPSWRGAHRIQSLPDMQLGIWPPVKDSPEPVFAPSRHALNGYQVWNNYFRCHEEVAAQAGEAEFGHACHQELAPPYVCSTSDLTHSARPF